MSTKPAPRRAARLAAGNAHRDERRHLWSQEPDLIVWLEGARLNPARGLRQRSEGARVQQAWQRFLANVRPGQANLERLWAQATGMHAG